MKAQLRDTNEFTARPRVAVDRSILARSRAFLADEAGATTLEYFMISAFIGAAGAITSASMGYSLYDVVRR